MCVYVLGGLVFVLFLVFVVCLFVCYTIYIHVHVVVGAETVLVSSLGSFFIVVSCFRM